MHGGLKKFNITKFSFHYVRYLLAIIMKFNFDIPLYRLWEDVFENGKHNKDNDSHGMISGEGGVFIEHGVHEINKDTHHYQKKIDDHDARIESGGENYLQSIEEATGEELSINNNHNQQSIETTASSSTTATSGDPINNTLKVFMCGAAAGTTQAIVICPMEHIKCRLQVTTQYKGPIDCCTSIIKNHGLFRGLYRGMGVTFWRETPAFGMYFATYDTIKMRVENLLEEKDEKHPIPSHAHAWAASALAGGISGAWTWAIIYPFDVIKSRIQTSPLENHLRKGMWTVAYDIINEHGWRYMFRGLGVTLARAFPVNAIIFPVYEFVLIQLGEGSDEAVKNAYIAEPNPSK